jgi:hypothetical protein
MEINTHINKNNPLHLYGYAIEDNNLVLRIVNCNNEFIDSLEIKFFEDVYKCEVNSKEEVFDVSVKIKNVHFIDKPLIISCTINGKFIKFDYSQDEYFSKASSVSKLCREKYLYMQTMGKRLNRDKKQIKFIADQIDDGWHCVCGTFNFHGQSKCVNCGITKKDLFDDPIDLSKESNKTRHLVLSTRVLLTYLVIISVIQIIFLSIAFGGDVLYGNQAVNTMFAVFNRVITPVLICLTTVGYLNALNKYNKLMLYAFETIRNLLVIYLNCIMCFKFVLTSYNFLMTMA